MRLKLSATHLAASGIIICALLASAHTKSSSYNGPVFEDVTRLSGLTVPHLSSQDKRYVIESMSGGVGLFDCDNDGKLDILTINGSTVDRYREGGDPMVTLYHQEPDGTFKDITKSAGLTRHGWGMGVAVADFDNDGWLDLFVANDAGPNYLYQNSHDGTFTEVGALAGVAFSSSGQAQGNMGVDFGDYDHRGLLDIFVTTFAD